MEQSKPFMTFHLVKNRLAYRVDVPPERRLIAAQHKYSFDFVIQEVGSGEPYSIHICLTEPLCAQKSELEQLIIAVRALYKQLGSAERSRTLGENFPSEFLSFDRVDFEDTRQEILRYARQRDNVSFEEPFYVMEFISAIHTNPEELVQQLKYWVSDGLFQFGDSLRFRSRAKKWGDYICFRMQPNKDRLRDVALVSSVVDTYKHYKILPIEADRFESGFIFCMTEFSGDSLRRFSEVIEPLCEPEFAMPAVISKHDDLPYKIDDMVVSHIHKCSLAIADISTRNPNVMYELGFAHAINKDVIIICDSALKGDKEIFDIRNINTIFFDNDEHLRDELKKKIRAVLNTTGTTKPS